VINLTPESAYELVCELQRRRCDGCDDRALIDYLCNEYRLGKRDARTIYDSFAQGFHHGADLVLDSGFDGSTPDSDDLVFHAASNMSVSYTQDLIDRRDQPKTGCFGSIAILLAIPIVIYATL